VLAERGSGLSGNHANATLDSLANSFSCRPEAMKDEILIAGAGIGGLTAALSLHQAGFAVRVFESVPELRPLGVGINLLPHAVRELDELGLLPTLDAAGVRCRKLSYCSKRGEPIWSELRGLSAGYRWPQISIHRGMLQHALLDAARERIGDDRLHMGHHLARFEGRERGVSAWFVDKRTGAELTCVEGRLLVAADGIHSAVRRAYYPNEGMPRWNGTVMWRGTVEAAPIADGHTMFMAGHARQKFVCYPISHRASRPGLQLINFVAELRYETTELQEREDWNRRGELADFLPEFESWRFPWLDVPALLRAAGEEIWVYPMIDRDPLPRWTHGSITLLGDAGHPMMPIGSNGASQAILDARVLTGCLRRYEDDPEHALERYDAIRREATSAIVLANRGQGPEYPMQLVEERAPHGFANLHDVVSAEELRAIADKYKRVAGFAIAELNERPSLAEPIA
jgi:2-polyprenyl-6-methoxyphenol hydroxylase-like FAD-dependent oxidoreductase